MPFLVSQYPHRPNTRPDSLNRPLEIYRGQRQMRLVMEALKRVSLYVTFPKSGGVRIRGGRPGFFEPESLCDIVYEEKEERTLKLSGQGISVLLTEGESGWRLVVCGADGKERTRISGESLFFGIDKQKEYKSVYLRLPMEEDEELFGFGERFNGVGQRGKELLMWNMDCMSGIPLTDFADEYCEKTQAYKNVPLVHSAKGYSIFFNTYAPIHFDIGASHPRRMNAEIYGWQLDLYLWTGRPEENLRSYLELTGKPFLPPKWAFGYWMGGGWNVWNLPDDTHALSHIRETVEGYEKLGVEVQAAFLEINPSQEIFDMLKQKGVRPLLWTNSCLQPAWGGKLCWQEYMVKKQSQPDQIMEFEYIDFTDSFCQDAIEEKFHWVWEMGLRGMMIDYADSMPEDALCRNGKTGLEMHNEYAYWYARRMKEGFSSRMGEDFILFQRSGCAGSQHYSASFGGDMPESFVGLKRSVWAGLSAAASGFSVWGSDLGGFYRVKEEGLDREELYIRWLQFATFSPLMRCHGLMKHDPWVMGEKAVECFVQYAAIRVCLLDYIYSAAVRSAVEGDPILKSMALAFDLSPTLDGQYLLGEDLLVCPIWEQGKRETEVFLPDDGWTEPIAGRRYPAGWHTVSAPLAQIPVFVRAGAALPVWVQAENGQPTLEKEHCIKALYLTKPVVRRESIQYVSKEERQRLVMEPLADGYELRADVPCEVTLLLAAGHFYAEAEGGHVVSCVYCQERHVTEIRVSGGFTRIRMKEKR